MICERCKKHEAEIFYTENVNGKEKKYSLCRECAAELEAAGEISMSFTDPLSHSGFGALDTIIGSLFAPAKQVRETAPKKKCDLCGMTFDDLTREGKAGCPRCYETFADELERTVAAIHGSTHHVGKVPPEEKARKEAEDKIAALKAKIAEAVAAEDYETAAKLRDEIKSLRGEE